MRRNSGRYSRTHRSQSNRPSSTKMATKSAVISLPVEPWWKRVVGSTGAPVATFAVPKPPANNTSSPFTIASSSPGTFHRASSGSISWPRTVWLTSMTMSTTIAARHVATGAYYCQWFFAKISWRIYSTSVPGQPEGEDEGTAPRSLDARSLRGLAHPLRVEILSLLSLEGPATSTTLAERLGVRTGTTSWHLQKLAEHGFITEMPERGNQRDRWWRLAAEDWSMDASEFMDDPELGDSAIVVLAAVISQHAMRGRSSGTRTGRGRGARPLS